MLSMSLKNAVEPEAGHIVKRGEVTIVLLKKKYVSIVYL